MRKNLRTRSKGFTLIELMVVIVIIAILGTGAFALFRDSPDEARYSRAKMEIKAAADLIQQYKVLKGKCPERIDDLKDLGDVTLPPKDDPWKRPYQYNTDGRKAFQYSSQGADDQSDDDDLLYDSEEARIVDFREESGS